MLEPIKVLIRADASPEIGGGHISRCIALAEAITDAGGVAKLVTLSQVKMGQSMLDAAAIPFEVICVDNQIQDALAVQTLLSNSNWLAVDSYGLNADWETTVRRPGLKVLVIDDLANRTHNCDISVDPGRINGASAYKNFVPPGCLTLTGPDYALLRRDFIGRARANSGGAKIAVLIFFGSTDVDGLTEAALNAINSANIAKKIDLNIILTDANPPKDAIRQRKGISIHSNVQNMAALMSKMDIAIGAGGVSLWERCLWGFPA